MNKKDEIIINNVDVAGCEFFDSNYCKLCDMRAALDELIVHRQYCDRTVNNDCYYKQLKRLEQENKELKEYKTSKENSYQLLQKQWKDLFVQNRELKEEKQQAIKDWEEKKNLAYELACKNERLKEENKELKDYEYYYLDKFLNLKQALEEIRELVKGRKNSEGIIRQTITEYLIQNKINEVLR